MRSLHVTFALMPVTAVKPASRSLRVVLDHGGDDAMTAALTQREEIDQIVL